MTAISVRSMVLFREHAGLPSDASFDRFIYW